MKRLLLAALTILALCPGAQADDKNKKQVQQQQGTEIQWMSVDEVQVKMRQAPRKVFVDMYTDWCGWCRKMDASTFHNPDVVKYMNDNFYCVKFNAERKDTIRFMSKYYSFDLEKKANSLAVEWMKGNMSYPTGIFMEERFQTPIPVAGYQDVKTWEMIVKYIGGSVYRTQKFEDYQKTFTPSWTDNSTPQSPVPNHGMMPPGSNPDEAPAPHATSDNPPVGH